MLLFLFSEWFNLLCGFVIVYVASFSSMELHLLRPFEELAAPSASEFKAASASVNEDTRTKLGICVLKKRVNKMENAYSWHLIDLNS